MDLKSRSVPVSKRALFLTVPDMMPADPMPAMALPRMNATELGAAPHTAEPTSKSRTADRKVNLTLKKA